MTSLRHPLSIRATGRALLFSAGLAAGLAGLSGTAAAADSRPRLLTLTASGEVRAAPDQAQLSAGVVSEAKTAAAALTDNSRKMTAVFAAIKKLGVPDRSVQTSGFNVSPQYPPYNSKQERHIIGYRVTNTVTVTLNDLKTVGRALDALVAAGANDINSVRFSIANPQPLLAKARVQAVRQAKQEAQTYAQAAGVHLGPIQSIREGGSTGPRPVSAMARLAAAPPPPIAAGEQTVSATVTISWEIQ